MKSKLFALSATMAIAISSATVFAATDYDNKSIIGIAVMDEVLSISEDSSANGISVVNVMDKTTEEATPYVLSKSDDNWMTPTVNVGVDSTNTSSVVTVTYASGNFLPETKVVSKVISPIATPLLVPIWWIEVE
jgi:hypothetical protein